MTKETKYYCDICKKEISNFQNKYYLKLRGEWLPAEFKYEIEHICKECAMIIYNAIEDALENRWI